MNLKKWTFAFLLCLGIASCIQDEALNSEAAIDACTGNDVQSAYIDNEEREIRLYVDLNANLSEQELIFTLPEGATVAANEAMPKDDIENNIYDFSATNDQGEHLRTFTVTSENKEWNVEYDIQIIPTRTQLPTNYHFELTDLHKDGYHIFYEKEEPTNFLQWASGNKGFHLTGMGKTAQEYPTVQADNGKEGKCVKLETKDTGSFGEKVKMYIAAGNLFIGEFDLSNALSDAPKATKFGLQFLKRPTRLKGYFKYKAGATFKQSIRNEEGKIIGIEDAPGKKDRFDIYAIFYEAPSNSFMLNGENALTHSSLVSVARIAESEAIETEQWTSFDLPFELQPGKEINEEKLKAGKYKLGIVLSSSVEGAYFNGAIGSTLYVDEMELICE